MKAKEKLAAAIAKISLAAAKKACGAASFYGVYQPKEPKCLDKLVK